MSQEKGHGISDWSIYLVCAAKIKRIQCFLNFLEGQVSEYKADRTIGRKAECVHGCSRPNQNTSENSLLAEWWHWRTPEGHAPLMGHLRSNLIP